MGDLVAFLRARIDDDETVARKAADDWEPDPDASAWMGTEFDVTPHVLRHDPARVLAEVEAKRRILRWHLDEECCSVCLDDVEGCPLFRALAMPYASHPDYREEW
ncbi:DUF6221 family protein [Streptomyces sp. NPDC007063]|uniref:DUF6221 family protein n=1 Tax=Streptomyces sp. NPDC007063 TaxID=3364772 RepID=UPI003694AFEE